MKSPFPGMDPFLERHWRDVHARLIIYASDRIQEQLPSGLRCRVEERVVLEPPQGQARSLYPDVRVVKKPNGAAEGVGAYGEGMTETFLEVVDVASGNKVITVVEVLSLSAFAVARDQDPSSTDGRRRCARTAAFDRQVLSQCRL